ncbi:unnamed protein product [Bursaphelenchus okinawaensis]|uniref:LIM interaction domain-containing protein n=1 Tax=Bursaphelenchus okinawaensis TaxID=465554 RepID=A0A811KGW1_9BILA|nr:unnamed protein product [Bursaphelenchus okinawaensis]CAG9103062.1 unnamed protein product [Bursaphelenchus okinawaensis]
MMANPVMPPNPAMSMPPNMPPGMAPGGMPMGMHPGPMPGQGMPGMPMGPMGGMGVPMMPNGPPQMHPGFPPLRLDLRIEEMNRRLEAFVQSRASLSPEHISQWWDAFSNEFFEPESFITYSILENRPEGLIPKKYTLSRTLIPRLFMTYMNTLTDMKIIIKAQQERFCAQGAAMGVALDAEIDWVMNMEKPVKINITAMSKFFIEFGMFDETFSYRIKHMFIDCKYAQETPLEPDQKYPPQTVCGIPRPIMELLKNAEILEPMKRVMAVSKGFNISPQESMRKVVFEMHQAKNNEKNQAMQNQMNAQQIQAQPPEEKAKTTRKRSRKTAANGGAPATTAQRKKGGGAQPGPSGPAPNGMGIPGQPFQPGYNMPMASTEVLVVHEPSMLGSDYAESDERAISRVENPSYDQNANNTMQSLDGPLMGQNQMAMGMNGMMMPPNSMNGS